jgi:hypothetical protein
MGTPVIVMIITLAMPNGDATVQVKPMQTAAHCRAAADLEAADPFVASVECSELSNGRLELEFRPYEQDSNAQTPSIEKPMTSNPRNTG